MSNRSDVDSILDHLPECIVIYDHTGRVTHWNAAAQKTYGWTYEQAVGREATEMLRCDRPVWLASFQNESIDSCRAALMDCGDWEGEITRSTAIGERILVEARLTVRRNDLGDMVEIVDRSRKLSRPMGANAALEISEQRYRTIFNLMPFAFWHLDTRRLRARYDALRENGVSSIESYLNENPVVVAEALRDIRISEVNQSAVEMLGARDAKQFELSLGDIWADQDAMRNSMIASYDRGEESYGGISKLETFDGRTIDVLWRVVFANGLAETGNAFFGAIDVTAQQESRDALALSERRYRDLFNYMPIALWQLDASPMSALFEGLAEAGVEDISAHARDHPDYLDNAVSALRIIEANGETRKLFRSDDYNRLIEAMPRLWRDDNQYTRAGIASLAGERSLRGTSRLQTIDGEWRDIVFAVAFSDPTTQDSVNLVGAVDITEQKRALEELQRLQADFAHAARVATLGELTASIAHEVNQPLTAIVTNGNASMRRLTRENPDLAEIRTLTSRMVADARQAADIIARIRTIASGRQPEREPVILNDIVMEARQFLDHQLTVKRVNVHLELAATLPEIFGDRTQLLQVVVNLAVNAIHALEEVTERNIWIRTFTAPEVVRCEIEDSGPGLATETIEQLFESFFTTKKDGLGIGLPICRSIVEAHGGQISGENGTAGARFVFELPRMDEVE